MVAMSLHRLGSDNGLQNIRNLYGVYMSLLSKILGEFCRLVRKHLLPVLYKLQVNRNFGFLGSRLEQLHDIPYILGPLDGSHMLSLGLVVGEQDSYYRKSFHSTIL